jgi:hypothetical protein
MKKLLLSGVVFGAMSSVALAAELLTEQQMVTAGLVDRGPVNLVQAGQKQHRFYLADVDREFFPG